MSNETPEKKLIDLGLNFVIPKYLVIGDPVTDLFSIDNFGKKYAGLYHTYMALKITSFQYGNQKHNYWFYRSAKDIGRVARLSEKQIQRYIQVLIRLELILAIKNPGKKAFIANPGLKKLFEERFKKRPNKPIYFFKISNLSEEAIQEKTLKAKEVNQWFNSKYKTREKAKNQRIKENWLRQKEAIEERVRAELQA